MPLRRLAALLCEAPGVQRLPGTPIKPPHGFMGSEAKASGRG